MNFSISFVNCSSVQLDHVHFSTGLLSLSYAYDYKSLGIDWSDPTAAGYVATCVGDRQSPINIVREDTIPADVDLPPLRKSCGEIDGGKFINSGGHTIKFETADGNPVVSDHDYMTGGPLGTDKYYFWQFHLHWGHYDCAGSEHTVDQNR